MNDSIEIKPDDLEQCARAILECLSELEGQMTIANTEITNLTRNGWRSAASERLNERFQSLRSKFNRTYPDVMRSYAEFLNQTAREYRTADAERKAAINAMMNLGAN